MMNTNGNDDASIPSTQQEQENAVESEGSLAENSIESEEESVASMPITEIQLRQDQDREERILRRSRNGDDEFMRKIVQERILLAGGGGSNGGDCGVHEQQQQQQQDREEQSAVAAFVAAGVPGAYLSCNTSSPSTDIPNIGAVTDRMMRTPVTSSNGNAVAMGNGDCKTGERPVSSFGRAFARASGNSRVATDRAVSPSKVGAIAVGGPCGRDGSSCSAYSACSATEMETSADLTIATIHMQSGSSTATQHTYLSTPQETLEAGMPAALAVAAEVAPEMMDLERSITNRVRVELEHSMRVSSEAAFENAPVAEIVGTMDRTSIKSPRQRQRQRRILAGACLGVMAIVAVTLGVVIGGARNNGYDFPPDHEVIADVPETICYERIPMLGKSGICPPQLQGSGSTNLVAESRLWNAPEAEISILNAGEVRIDMEQGNFTMGQARELLPFDFNTLVLIDIKGAKLVTALERGIQKIFDDKAAEEGLNSTTPSGAFPYGAGIRWNVNMSQPFPRRLYDIEINPRFEGQWQPLDFHRVYTIVTNSYLAAGGDAYHEFSSAEEEHVVETNLNSLESFVEYCHYFGVLLNPPEDHYSTQTYIHNDILF